MENFEEKLKNEIERNMDRIHRTKQAINNFSTTIAAKILEGKTTLGELFGRYLQMRPTLHRGCNKPQIDFSALIYALSRLPVQIADVKGIYIVKDHAGDIDRKMQKLKTIMAGIRRRVMYDLGEEIEIIARDNQTDIIDIVTCLSIYGIESLKISKSLKDDPIISEIKDYTKLVEPKKSQLLARIANKLSVNFADLKKTDEALNHEFIPMLSKIATQDVGNILITFDRKFQDSDAVEKAINWAENIRKAMSIYSGRPIAIISSDSHSVVNCLTGFAEKNKETIKSLLRKYPEIKCVPDKNDGAIYCALQELCRPEREAQLKRMKIQHEEFLGIKYIKDKFDTGIDVQIIDIKEILNKNSKNIDKRLRFNLEKARQKGLIILNMDYSFGGQGNHILRALCDIFSEKIESISIIGKAGITKNDGGRFEIMLPNGVIPQIDSGIYLFPNNNGFKKEDFKDIFQGKIHENGPMLSVPGTVMQNDYVLGYYIYTYGILGVEMEAAPYLNAIEKKKQEIRNGLRKDILINVGYWASDIPLNPEQTLAESHLDEGYIAHYALVIASLNKALNHNLPN